MVVSSIDDRLWGMVISFLFTIGGDGAACAETDLVNDVSAMSSVVAVVVVELLPEEGEDSPSSTNGKDNLCNKSSAASEVQPPPPSRLLGEDQ